MSDLFQYRRIILNVVSFSIQKNFDAVKIQVRLWHRSVENSAQRRNIEKSRRFEERSLATKKDQE
jgi:hypothetical protein